MPCEHRRGREDVGHDAVLADQLGIRPAVPLLRRALEEGEEVLVVHRTEQVVIVGACLVQRVAVESGQDRVDPLRHLGAGSRNPHPYLVLGHVQAGVR